MIFQAQNQSKIEPSVLPGYDDDEMSRLVTKRCAGTAAGAGLPSVHPRGANFGLARTATPTTTLYRPKRSAPPTQSKNGAHACRTHVGLYITQFNTMLIY